MIFNATDLTFTAKINETFGNIFVRGNAENGILRGFIAKTSTKISNADGQINGTEDCAMGEGHKTEPKCAAVNPQSSRQSLKAKMDAMTPQRVNHRN
ncbi:hypothetical protein C813_21230 [Kosakonia sacchari SP1]|nr:hypothetical protein C813_21230 [Kosakonia sacchari SP1]